MRWLILGLLALALGCGGSEGSASPEFECSIGELTGAWLTKYSEANGDCGPLNDETTVLDPGRDPPEGCEYHTTLLSDDLCRIDSAWTCPTSDGRGEQSWEMVLLQVAADGITGTATVQINHPGLLCRSTYDVSMSAL